MLEKLKQKEFIRSHEISYQEKAAYLTNLNEKQNLGYMMIHILDEEINIYREDIGLASNLASREYMQQLYTTGEIQVTDAFLAGADGETINYTVAVGIEENGKITGALMAAIYGKKIDESLWDDACSNVLVGSELQYMGGIDQEQFGMGVAQVQESEGKTSRPVENILLDFYEKKEGTFWGAGRGLQYFVYSPIEHANWIVMTEVSAISLIPHILVLYALGVAVVLAVGILLELREKKKCRKIGILQ